LNRFLVPVIVFLALAGVLFIGVKHSPDKSTMVSQLLGKPAPAFELPVLGEPARKFSTRELAGKPWVMNVWATWCGECRAEHETLIAIAGRSQVTLVGLNWRDEDEAAQQWLKELGNPYNVVAVDAEGRAAIDFGVYGAPETFFVDANGIVQYRHVGAMSQEVWDREFESRLTHKGFQ